VLNVRVTEAGEKAAEAMRKMYTSEELLSCNAGYTENDLIKLGIIALPKADNVKISGLAAVGAEISGLYEYTGSDEGNSKFGFEMSAEKDGSYISFSNAKRVKLSETQRGKYVRFFVTPVNTKGYEGETYYSDAVRVTGTAGAAAENVIVTDEKGQKAVDISSAESLNVQLTLVNYNEHAQKVWVMLFVYDAEGNMLDNRAVSAEIAAGGRKDIDGPSINLPAYSSGNYAKLIIWDGLTTMNSAQNCAVLIK
jgi:hypothetical protein